MYNKNFFTVKNTKTGKYLSKNTKIVDSESIYDALIFNKKESMEFFRIFGRAVLETNEEIIYIEIKEMK